MAESKPTKILAGNWKLHKCCSDVEAFFQELSVDLVRSNVRKMIAASPTLLVASLEASTGTGIEVFSQNCSWADSGAFTGEISPVQLKDIGVQGTLVGHSERRQFFGDSNDATFRRLEAALKNDLDVIFCIGEDLEMRKAGRTLEIIEQQLAPALPLAQSKAHRFIVAYEPVWAIGSGLTANNEQIVEAHTFIASLLKVHGVTSPVLYGGSVNTTNFKEIAGLSNVSGGLVGGASLEAASFRDLHSALT